MSCKLSTRNNLNKSKHVPFSSSEVTRQHLVSTPPDVLVTVSVKNLKRLGHLVLIVLRAAVTHVVKHLVSDLY